MSLSKNKLSSSKRSLKVGTVVVGPYVFVVTEALVSDKRNRFNVHRINLLGNLDSVVIAREVTKGIAEKTIRKVANEGLV